MLSRETIYSMAEQLPGTGTDSPFEDNFDAVVLRHMASGKWFGLVFKAPCRKIGLDRDGETDILNLKCDPVFSYGLIQSYDAIIPAYHMNKHHWISIILEKDLPADMVEMLIGMSYDLTKPKKRSKSKSIPENA